MHNLIQGVSKQVVIRRKSCWISSLDGISPCASGLNHRTYSFAHL